MPSVKSTFIGALSFSFKQQWRNWWENTINETWNEGVQGKQILSPQQIPMPVSTASQASDYGMLSCIDWTMELFE